MLTNTRADAKVMFEAEQTRKENVIIKEQKAEIQRQNRQLQDTIDELTRNSVRHTAAKSRPWKSWVDEVPVVSCVKLAGRGVAT